MSVPIGALYHWAPRRLREIILRKGLVVMIHQPMPEGERYAFSWICFATTPSSAWGLINYPDGEEEHGWDLWQTQPEPQDSLSIRGDFSPMIREVRIENSVPADRLWWVGERLRWAHETILEGGGL